MKPSTKIAIAGLLSALGAVLTAFASEFTGGAPEADPTEPAAPAEPKKRGRPAKVEAPAAPDTAPTTPAEGEPEPGASTPAEKEEKTGKTYEELRAIIEPHVKEGKGEEVKKIIAKYSTGGLKTMEAKHHAAFEKDIQALSY